MPPRPPVTTLVIHTWKEHGKPRPLSNQEQSTQAARDRISRSLSYDKHLAHLKQPEDELLSSRPHRPTAVIRSTSVEEALLTSKCSPVMLASPLSTPQLSDDDSDGSFDILPVKRFISTPFGEDKPHISPPSEDKTKFDQKGHNRAQERAREGLPPRPVEWPLCHRRQISRGRGIPPRAVSLLLAEDIPNKGKSRRARARSVGTTPFEASLLGESMIQGSTSFDAGLCDVARRGIVQSCTSPNV